MKKDIRKDIFTIIAVTVAAFLMALNTKTFVNTGGLYPGGMTGNVHSYTACSKTACRRNAAI